MTRESIAAALAARPYLTFGDRTRPSAWSSSLSIVGGLRHRRRAPARDRGGVPAVTGRVAAAIAGALLAACAGSSTDPAAPPAVAPATPRPTGAATPAPSAPSPIDEVL